MDCFAPRTACAIGIQEPQESTIASESSSVVIAHPLKQYYPR